MISDDPSYFVDGVRSGDRRVLARTITLIESTLPEHRELARKIVDELVSASGKAVRLGITGVPGVGKSTFIESFGTMLVQDGHRVAVLAVDPSSKRSGGSILADKTRMERLAVEPNAFIRPSPSGGTLGGVAKKTRESLLVCEAAGFDVMIVETVGVGQSETAVASMVDFFLVLMIAGAGDELQGMKKGVLELADAIAINKADGDNVKKAERARKEYENALHYLRPATPTWTPPVLTCSAKDENRHGIRKIWETVLDHRRRLEKTSELAEKRRRQAVDWMWDLINDGLQDRFRANPSVRGRLSAIVKEVEKGTAAPTAAAAQLLFLLDKENPV